MRHGTSVDEDTLAVLRDPPNSSVLSPGSSNNLICPGAITTNIGENTEQRHVEKEKEPVKFGRGSSIPLTRGAPGSAEQVAELVLFLASDASDHITGTEVWIDGGFAADGVTPGSIQTTRAAHDKPADAAVLLPGGRFRGILRFTVRRISRKR